MPLPTTAVRRYGRPALYSFAAMFTGRTAASSSPDSSLAAIASADATASTASEAFPGKGVSPSKR